MKFNGTGKGIVVTVIIALIGAVFAYGMWRGSKTECDKRQDEAIGEIKVEQKELRECYQTVLIEQKVTNKTLERLYPTIVEEARSEVENHTDTVKTTIPKKTRTWRTDFIEGN